MTEPLPDWERDLLTREAAEKGCAAAIRAGQAVLDAYDRGLLTFSPAYLADTLRMVLGAVRKVHDADAEDGYTRVRRGARP